MGEKKTKVLLISPMTGVVGGISMWTGYIMEHYAQAHSDCAVELCDFSRVEAGSLIRNPFVRVCKACSAYVKLMRKACRQIEAFDGEVVHLCTSAGALLVKDVKILKAARRRGLKTVIHFHFGRIPELAQSRGWEWKLLCRVVKLADAAVVMDKSSFTVLNGCGFRNVYHLPNPLAPAVISQIAGMEAVERERGRLFFAGHCIPTKGVFELVRACAGLQTDFRLVMAGAISQEMRAELTDIGGDWLEIKGQLSHEETLHEMKKCSIFVLPTYTEGFPNVILESMACGCAIVASAVGAIPEMIGDGAGVLVESRNESELRAALEKLLSDEPLQRQIGAAAAQQVVERYGIETVCTGLEAIWKNDD